MVFCKFSSSTVVTKHLCLNSQTLLLCRRCCSATSQSNLHFWPSYQGALLPQDLFGNQYPTILIDKFFCIHNKELFSTALPHPINYLCYHPETRKVGKQQLFVIYCLITQYSLPLFPLCLFFPDWTFGLGAFLFLFSRVRIDWRRCRARMCDLWSTALTLQSTITVGKQYTQALYITKFVCMYTQRNAHGVCTDFL